MNEVKPKLTETVSWMVAERLLARASGALRGTLLLMTLCFPAFGIAALGRSAYAFGTHFVVVALFPYIWVVSAGFLVRHIFAA